MLRSCVVRPEAYLAGQIVKGPFSQASCRQCDRLSDETTYIHCKPCQSGYVQVSAMSSPMERQAQGPTVKVRAAAPAAAGKIRNAALRMVVGRACRCLFGGTRKEKIREAEPLLFSDMFCLLRQAPCGDERAGSKESHVINADTTSVTLHAVDNTSCSKSPVKISCEPNDHAVPTRLARPAQLRTLNKAAAGADRQGTRSTPP